jgi:transcriptional regulator with XRE-family HTH domain
MAHLTDPSLLRQIATRLKAVREARGLTQEQVFVDTTIHVGRIETARINVTVSTVAALCTYFEIDLPTFFAFDKPLKRRRRKSP